ncbi:hypothetical protein Ciccas_012538 [Cichlidogyrus casuarinus]|uniref:Serine aminopeptidase S33 domain-containing protein n=1 Tax=Cichlidogyrus casuarinus TaxID=1844966 RepID=A0ABD2PN76_9PLAT
MNPLEFSKKEKPAHFTVLFSHGNAVDIGQHFPWLQMAWFLVLFACKFNVNVFCYDYSGYGLSSGQTLEKNLYADAEAAIYQLKTRYNVPLDQIVLYGQSIGTAPTVHLATKYKVAGVVLHSPLMSGLRVICPKTKVNLCFDPFANINKVAKIQSPTLIIHGEQDEMIGIHHGEELHAKLQFPLNPAWIKNCGHNDIEISPDYPLR